MNRLIRWSAAAALVFAAQHAAAQAAGGAPPAPATQGAVENPGAAATIERLHDMNAKMIHVGKLGAERGTTPNVKEYGQRIATEHERLDRELTQFAQRRGIQLKPAEQLASEPAHVQAWQAVAAKSGLEFDRAYIDGLVTERVARVDELKQLRDGTPGKDAELKRWIDEVEQLAEKTRNEARNVRQAVLQQDQQQRQGRRP